MSARFCLCPFCRRRLSPLWLAIILIAAQFLHSPKSRLHPLPILIFLLLRTSWLLTSFGFMPKNSAAETKADQSFVFECHTNDFPMKTFDFDSSPEWLVQQYLYSDSSEFAWSAVTPLQSTSTTFPIPFPMSIATSSLNNSKGSPHTCTHNGQCVNMIVLAFIPFSHRRSSR